MKKVVQLLRSKVIPWTTSGFAHRHIVARPVMREVDLPEGVTLSLRKLSGRRTIVRHKRVHGNQRLFTAIWPDDNLHEITVPKISCVVHGVADYLMSKYSVYCNEGAFQIIPSGMPHQRYGPYLEGQHLHNGYCEIMYAYAHSQGVLFWLTSSRNGQHFNDEADNYLIYDATLTQLLTLAVEEAVANQTDSELICNNYLSAFYAFVAREIENGNYVALGAKEDLHNSIHPTATFTERVHEYIEANCNGALRVEDVARHMFMSNSHFFRRMHEETGVTFTELLTHYRIELACRLLRDTNLTAIAINDRLGFKSPTYFQNLFRVRMGCTPMEYRDQSRKVVSQKIKRKS